MKDVPLNVWVPIWYGNYCRAAKLIVDGRIVRQVESKATDRNLAECRDRCERLNRSHA